METNEALKTTMMREAETEIVKLLTRVEAVQVGDLRGVEREVLSSVFALGRRMLEQVVQNQPETQQAPARQSGACGHEQRLVGKRPKQIVTLLGPVTIQRAYYHCLPAAEGVEQESAVVCTHGEAPADKLWGIGKRRTSAGVQEQISYLCASLTLEEAAATFSRLYPLQMSARQTLYLMQPVGEALASREQQQSQALWEQAAQTHTASQSPQEPAAAPIERLYVELDGVFTRLRRGSVPMKEQEEQREGDVYREVKAGAVFAARPGPERSELVEGVFIDAPVEDSLRYVAQRTALGDFGRRLYALAVAQGLARAKQVVVLGDGASWLWRLAEEHFPEAVQIVDLFHAKEHVWEVAAAVFGRTTSEGVTWATRACDWLAHGQIDRVVHAIAALPAVAPPPGQSKSVPEQAIGYFTGNARRMQYPAFRAQGMHIGSGIAEATCKTVVSTRTKRSGMRWTPQGLDALLPLRTAVLNGAYDQFWQGRAHALV